MTESSTCRRGHRIDPASKARLPRAGQLLCAFFLACLTAACGSVLPSGSSVTVSPWKSFDQAKAAYDRIEVGKTTRKDLTRIGYDPEVNPNVEILTYLDLIALFMPHQAMSTKDLDPRLRECLALREHCTGYRVGPQRISSRRTGNALLDIFGFKRKTERSGWTFTAVVVMDDGTVAYKIWSGKPHLLEKSETKQPLGPLQDSGDLLREVVRP